MLLSPLSTEFRKRSMDLDALNETDHARIREFTTNVSSNLDDSSKSKFSTLISQYLANSIKLTGLIKETREIMGEEQDCFPQLVQLFLAGDQPKNMQEYLMECGVNECEFSEFVPNNSPPPADPLISTDPNKATWIGSTITPFAGIIQPKPKKGSRKPPNKWNKEESQRLIELVETYGDKRWKKISQCIGGGKTGAQCAQHWKRVLCPEIRKGTWDVGEEENLLQLVAKYGQAWKKIAIELKTRTDIQCRYQYLKACMSREEKWGADEDKLLALKVTDFWKAEKEVSWLEIAKHLGKAKRTKIPRTALECKARWSEISDRDDILFLTSKTRDPFQAPISYATAKPIISQRMPQPNMQAAPYMGSHTTAQTSPQAFSHLGAHNGPLSLSSSSSESGNSSDCSPPGNPFYPSVLYNAFSNTESDEETVAEEAYLDV
eukprot:Phypoly_transcript_07937.p1 GENE.Phypoly_transcript_07937~~Phypoly_transcript_07937.p1  ORF type:complete len:434 (+),score=71.95 Phypoly_transcript_07937:220-1521(+)